MLTTTKNTIRAYALQLDIFLHENSQGMSVKTFNSLNRLIKSILAQVR